MHTLRLTESLRHALKIPLGKLVEGTPEYCSRVLGDTIEKMKPVMVLLVGDAISRNAIRSGINVDILIIDNREKRQKSVSFSFGERNQFRLRNAPGTIDGDAWEIVNSAKLKGKSVIIVEGEEDLLALVAVLEAPIGALVAYGQPDRGIVIVNVTDSEKAVARSIIEAMETSSVST